MRKLGALLALAPSLAFAGDGMLGTKAGGGFSPVASSSAGTPPLLQTLVAIAIVVALLKYGLPKLAKLVGAKESTGGIRVEESTSLAGGHLHVVTARGRTLLVGASSHGFATLADLTEAPSAQPALFMDLVSNVEPFVPPAPSPDSARETFPSASSDLLARLDRLVPARPHEGDAA